MKRIFLISLVFLATVQLIHAQLGHIAPVGKWTAYVSHKNVKEIDGIGQKTFMTTTGGYFEYDLVSKATYTMSKVDGLSGTEPTTILADSLTNQIFLGFSDGMINVVDSTRRIHYIGDISRTNLFTVKGIVKMLTHDSLLYIAARFGVVVYDLERRETRISVTKIGSNPTGQEIFGMAELGSRLYVSMGSRGVWSADIYDPDFEQPSAWTKESSTQGIPNASVTVLAANDVSVYALMGDSIYRRLPSGIWERSPFPNADYNYLGCTNNQILATYKPSFAAILTSADTIAIHDRQGSVTCAYAKDSILIVGDATVGFSRNDGQGGFYGGAPSGPRNNFVTDLAATNGGVYIAPRGKKEFSNRFNDRSGIPYFNLHNGGWRINDYRSGALVQGDVWLDFARAEINPITQECVVGSWGDGFVLLDSGKVRRTFSHRNSGLSLSLNNDHRVSGLAFDQGGNLWLTQMINTYSLNVLTADSNWYYFNPMPGINPVGIETDEYGNKWIIDQDNGLVIFNDNFTPADPSDDRVRTITSAYGNGGLPNNSVRSLALDHDQQMWIGTTDGVTILYDPSLMFSTDFQDAACPIIDGYCLMRGQEVYDIAVDGFNRKWIATNTGVYLVNLDGTVLLEHFNEENSPLLSNTVNAVTIDQTTGEVFFGTSKGLVSYMGDAIAGKEDASELYVYPNPVPWYYDQPIMIKGMRTNSQVRICTVAGEVVRELLSQGGEVPWDGNDAYGNRVNPGIYLIMVADPTGQGAGITKVAILEHPR